MSLFKELALKIKFFWGSLFYLTYAPYALIYSLKRDRLERQFPAVISEEGFASPGKLLRGEKGPGGATFYFESAELEIHFLAADLVRVNWKPGLPPVPYAIARKNWEEVETILSEIGDDWQLSSEKITITVKVDGSIQFNDQEGKRLRQELPPQKAGSALTHQAVLQPEEHIYGLGERAAPLNLRDPKDGRLEANYQMWNFDAAGMYGPGSDPLYICIPLYLGLHERGSYLVFYENSFAGNFKFDNRQNQVTANFEGGSLRYYLITGTPATILERYTELTGRPAMPPKWALGYHQSHWGYRTEQAVREEVEGFVEHDLPLSAVHLDIDVQVGFRAFTIDPNRFPNMLEFTKELMARGVRFITILNPGIKYSRQSQLFLEGQVLGAFCRQPNGELVSGPVWPGWCVFPDYTNPVVREWWSRQYRYMLDVGVAGFWHDMNEPAAFITWGDRSLPKSTQHFMEGRGGDHREAHNIYGMMQAQASYEGLRGYQAGQRPFIVSRAGWAGLQRYSWTWTGDIECTWEAMRQTVATVVGLGLSGIPYSGPDIGGFQGNPPAELYLRWFQMASFLPFCRTHSSNNAENRRPWSYGEPTLKSIRELLVLRYRLLPYFYTLAWQANQTGTPLVRPVFWADFTDQKLWGIEDAFLLGNALLVCPIFEAEARSRLVQLPQGRWYNFWNDESMEGPGEVELEAPLETIPLLVKACSLLPLEEGKQLQLHLYPPVVGSCENVVYSDAGDGYGQWRLDRLQMVWVEGGLDVFWQQEGEYPFPYERVEVHLHGGPVAQVWVDEGMVKGEGNSVATLVVDSPFNKAHFKLERL